uniref:Uncharacterized protein n=1 Tax=Rhizophora mucronata TaxID=61149 RepID=A0A2P2IJZ2_RHIMU
MPSLKRVCLQCLCG